MYRKVVTLALLVLLIGTLAPGRAVQAFQAAPGALEQMLAQVPDNQLSRTAIWYGSSADLERILGFQLNQLDDFQKLPKAQQATYLLDVGNQVYYSPFSGTEQSTNWLKTFGIDPFVIDREVTVGTQPNWYAILSGKFPKDSITQALQNLGYKAAQVNKATVFSLGADNAADTSNQVGKLAASRYNRLIVTDNQIIAAPSTGVIQAATAGGNAIVNDAAYAALVRALEGQATLPNTTLLSGVLFNGPFLVSVIGGPGSGTPLPAYQTAGIGYRRDANNRYWVIALTYPTADAANQAGGILVNRMENYVSQTQPGRKLFDGWKFDAKVTPSADNKVQVVTVTMQLPPQTDLSWIDLVANRDVAFLGAAR